VIDTPRTDIPSKGLCAAGLALVAGLALGLPTPARAQAEEECYGISPTDTAFAAAEVSPGQARLNFVDSPRANSTRASAFLVPGDVVVISRQVNGFGCASYLNTRLQATTGWLPLAALRPVPEQRSLPAVAWSGVWQGARILDQKIEISPRSMGLLSISGSATWGRADPQRVARGGVNAGSLEGQTQAQGNLLAFAEDGDRTLPYEQGDPNSCRVRMFLLGPYLTVQDNLRCGGMNVTFNGVYRRAAD
jgi:hypothetical protein